MTTERANMEDLQKNLLEALLQDDLRTFTSILEDRRVNPKHYYSEPIEGSCLDISAASGRTAFIRALLPRLGPLGGAKPEPLHRAAQGGHSRALAALLGADGDAAVTDGIGRTALHYVCHYASDANIRGFEECVDILLRHFSPEDLNREDKCGYTALHIAVASDVTGFPANGIHGGPSHTGVSIETDEWLAKRRIVDLILRLGKDVLDLDSSRAHGLTTRDAILDRFPDIKSQLPLSLEGFPDQYLALIEAMYRGQVDVFRALLYKMDVNDTPELDPNYWIGPPVNATPLELACSTKGGAEFVRILLDCGADPDYPNKLNLKFPIHIACERGDSKILETLLTHEPMKADRNLRDALGNTALHYIACSGNNYSQIAGNRNFKKCLEFLLCQEDLLVNVVNDKHESPLHVALLCKNREFVCEMLNKKFTKINFDLRHHGRNIHELISEVYPDLKALLPTVSSVHESEELSDDMKLLEVLKKGKEMEVIEMLRLYPLRGVSRGDRQNTPLQYAARFGLVRATEALLDAGANPNGKAENNELAPIHLACKYGHTEVLRALLSTETRVKVFVNKRDPNGNTALHFAAKKQDLESVILLLKYGANWKIENMSGKSPFDGCLEGLLNKCIKTNDKSPHSEDYAFVFDYRLFIATSEFTHESPENLTASVSQELLLNYQANNDLIRSEMNLFPILLHYSKGPELLNHPVTASFLHLKWSRVRWMVFMNILNLIQYLIVLNIHIVLYSNAAGIHRSLNPSGVESLHNDTDAIQAFLFPLNPVPHTTWLILVATVLFFFREVFQLALGFRVYWSNPENIIDIATFAIALWIVVPPAFVHNWMVHPRWIWFFVLAIMVSSTDLLLLTGRLRQFAKNIELLKVVLVRYIKTAFSYVIIIIAFALSFHIVFRTVEDPANEKSDEDRFQSFPFSIVRVLTMMTGEFDSGSIPLEKTTTGTILFVVFVLGVTVVLFNLLIGVAVSDMETIQDDAERRWLKGRVHTVMDMETILVKTHNSYLCRAIRRYCCPWLSFFSRATLFKRPNTPHEARVCPADPESFRLGDSDKSERRLDYQIVKSASEVLKQRNMEIISGSANRCRSPLVGVDRATEVLWRRRNELQEIIRSRSTSASCAIIRGSDIASVNVNEFSGTISTC